MYRRLHDDVKQLAFARVRVHCLIVAALDTKDNLEHVRDEDVAPRIAVGIMELQVRVCGA